MEGFVVEMDGAISPRGGGVGFVHFEIVVFGDAEDAEAAEPRREIAKMRLKARQIVRRVRGIA